MVEKDEKTLFIWMIRRSLVIMTTKEQFYNRDTFQGIKKREGKRHILWTVDVENDQENFCGEIKGAK